MIDMEQYMKEIQIMTIFLAQSNIRFAKCNNISSLLLKKEE